MTFFYEIAVIVLALLCVALWSLWRRSLQSTGARDQLWRNALTALAARDYESAGARYSPFNSLQEPDKLSRNRIAALVRTGLSYGRDVYVIAANNAEGSAPLTLVELVKTIVTN